MDKCKIISIKKRGCLSRVYSYCGVCGEYYNYVRDGLCREYKCILCYDKDRYYIYKILDKLGLDYMVGKYLRGCINKSKLYMGTYVLVGPGVCIEYHKEERTEYEKELDNKKRDYCKWGGLRLLIIKGELDKKKMLNIRKYFLELKKLGGEGYGRYVGLRIRENYEKQKENIRKKKEEEKENRKEMKKVEKEMKKDDSLGLILSWSCGGCGS